MPKGTTVTIEVPATLASELASADQALVNDLLQRGLRDLHIERALAQYQEGRISFAAAAELAGISLANFSRAAYAKGIEPEFDAAMVDEELG